MCRGVFLQLHIIALNGDRNRHVPSRRENGRHPDEFSVDLAFCDGHLVVQVHSHEFPETIGRRVCALVYFRSERFDARENDPEREGAVNSGPSGFGERPRVRSRFCSLAIHGWKAGGENLDR